MHPLMLKTIKQLAYDTACDTGRPEFNPRVMATLATIPRHEFVPDYQQPYAYDNRPLPIGYGQTISQPYIVALMTDLLDPQPDHIVLEIGTGSGYQTAILSQLVKTIYTIEIIAGLALQAQTRFQQLGYNNIEVKNTDGYYGWEEHAPFDTIIVTAATQAIPPPLIQQLKPGGRMIIPIGEHFHVQYLTLLEKDLQNNLKAHPILPVAFVPLTGKH